MGVTAIDWGDRHPRWKGVVSDEVELCDVTVHLLRAAAPTGDGTPHLLIHGLGGSAHNWIDVIPALAKLGPVVAVDLPGFGRTVPPTKRAPLVGVNARFLGALMGLLGWPSAVVHGSSMGGTVATMFAARSPELVERLVLVAPALPARRRRPDDLDRETLRRFAVFVVRPFGDIMLRRRLRGLPVDELWRGGMAFVHGDPTRINPVTEQILFDHFTRSMEEPWVSRSYTTAAASLVSALLWRRQLLRAIDAVMAPTLVVRGGADRLVSASVVENLQERRDDWEVALLEGVGHVPMLEVPDRYMDIVTDWMALGSMTSGSVTPAVGSPVTLDDRFLLGDAESDGTAIVARATGSVTP